MRKTFLFKNKQNIIRSNNDNNFLNQLLAPTTSPWYTRVKQKLNPMKHHHNDVEKELNAVKCVPLGVTLGTSDMCGFISVPL